MIDFVLGDGGHDDIFKKYVGPGDCEGHPLWSGRYLKDNPALLRRVIQDTIQTGAQMILTYTYQTTVDTLQKHYNISTEEALDIIRSSVKISREAVELERAKGLTRPIDIVGVIGPYGATLHDGSEYSGGHYVDNMSLVDLAEWHKPRLSALIEAGCDYLFFGTMPSLKEVEALITLLKQHPEIKAIISFSAQNEKTISHGEALRDAALQCWRLAADQILAIGVNCLQPHLAEPLLRSIRDANPDIPLSVKPNTTEIFNKETRQWEPSGDQKTVREYCRDWLKLGVKYISGCCRTSMEDIINFREEIEHFKNKSSLS